MIEYIKKNIDKIVALPKLLKVLDEYLRFEDPTLGVETTKTVEFTPVIEPPSNYNLPVSAIRVGIGATWGNIFKNSMNDI